EEACRGVDRLERLDGLLQGREEVWLSLAPASLDGSVVTVMVGNVLVEARQQQMAVKSLLAELRQSRAARARPVPASERLAGVGGGELSDPAGVAVLGGRSAERQAAG